MKIFNVVGLSHISHERAERLIKERVLQEFDFSYLDTSTNYIEGKFPIKVRKGKRTRKHDVLDLIHNDVSEPISPLTIGGFKYFILFIDYHSRFGWVDLLTKKSKSLEAFKRFKVTIELKLC